MNDPVLIFFVALAAFLSYRLFSVLGTKGGHDPRDNEAPRPVPVPDAVADAADEVKTESHRKPDAPWVATVKADLPDFDAKHFVEGAKSAYEMIVTAYANGDLGDIKPYIDSDVFGAFDAAVASRAEAGQTMDVTFVGIESAEVENAKREGDRVKVTVSFRSDQIRVTRDDQGEVIDGDPNRIDLVRDRWTFARPAGSRDPNWILIATGGGGGPAV